MLWSTIFLLVSCSKDVNNMKLNFLEMPEHCLQELVKHDSKWEIMATILRRIVTRKEITATKVPYAHAIDLV